jgi:hypothetical protein
MSYLGAILGLKRPLVDGEHRLFEPRPAPLDTLMRASMVAARAKRRTPVWGQLRRPHQHRSGLVDGLVDALVTQPHRRFVGKPSTQMAADLLRGPPLRQQLTDQLAELTVRLDA